MQSRRNQSILPLPPSIPSSFPQPTASSLIASEGERRAIAQEERSQLQPGAVSPQRAEGSGEVREEGLLAPTRASAVEAEAREVSRLVSAGRADSAKKPSRTREEKRGVYESSIASMLTTSLTVLEPMNEGSSLIVVRGTVNGVECGDILIDSGAASCFVSEQWARGQRLPVQPLRQPLKVSLGDGVTEGTLIGMVAAAEVTTQRSTATCSLLVMKTLSHHVILGMPWLEKANVTINFQQREWNGKRLIDLSPLPHGPVKGRSCRRAVLCAVKVGREYAVRVDAILRCYPTAFRTDLLRRSTVSLAKAIKCKITLKDPNCRPTADGERRRSPADRGILIEVVREMEAAGLIRPSKSPWSSQAVLVKKMRDGVEIAEKRPCWDYRRVNDLIVGDAHPLPLPENMFAELTGSQLFSKMDLLKGFWQIPLDENSKAILAMATPLGLYEPNNMPFGMKNAPAVFQREMQRVLRDRLSMGVLVFIDDILIHSKTAEEHEELVRWVLGRLVEEGYYAHPDKCEFFQKEVSFLGHVISGKGVSVQAHKVKAVQEWPVLTTKREVRQFLGLVNWYRKFIADYSEIARPLTDLTHDNHPWSWGEKEQTAFDTLKQKLSTADVLAHPDPKRQWIIHTDASEFAIAGVLSQKQADDTVRPVAYFSRKMSGAETKYDSIHEKELLALVKAVEHWRCYLEGSAFPVLLYTDHKGLSWLNTQKELTGRQTRWVERLAELEYKVIHIAGEDNGVADALSRRSDYEGAPLVEVASEGREASRTVSVESPSSAGRDTVTAMAAETPPVRTRIVLHSAEVDGQSGSQLEAESKREAVEQSSESFPPLMAEIREAVSRDEWYRAKMEEEHPTDGLVREVGLLRTVSGQWYIPDDTELKARLLYEVHDSPSGGHLGVKKTLHKLQRVCWWLGMRAEVTGYVHSCVECQRVKHSQQKPAGLLLPLPIPSRPYDTITMDFVGPLPPSGERAYDYILTVVDKFSKRVNLLPCHKTIDAHQTARLLIDNVVRQHGLPASIVSDRDPRWTGVLWTELFAAMGTKLKRSSSYHPQTDGQTERVHRVLEAMLRAYVNKRGTDWSEWLPTVEMSINSSVQEATGKTPFEMTGVDWKDPMSLAMTSGGRTEMTSDVAHEVLDGIKTAWEDARHMMMESQVRMKKYADLRRRDEQYAVGDQVMLSTKNLAKRWGKLSPLFVGPFLVLKVSGEGLNVTLDLPSEYSRLHQPFHVSRVKRYSPSEIQWVGREQVEKPLPDLIDGQPMWEVEAIKGKKLDTRMVLVYDTRPVVEEKVEEKAEAEVLEASQSAEMKTEEKKEGGWGSRLRTRVGPSVAAAAVPSIKAKKTRKVKARKEAVTRTMYLVKYKGYEEEYWMPEDELQLCEEAIEQYEREQAAAAASRSEDSVALHCVHSWVVDESSPGTAVWCGAVVV
jgi:hypothetical protein